MLLLLAGSELKLNVDQHIKRLKHAEIFKYMNWDTQCCTMQ